MTPQKTTLDDLVGKELPPSGWRTIDQEAVDRFAAVTGDDQWIHVDPERAKGSPFGTTIVHGYFTLALAPVLLAEILDLTDFGTVMNYGIGRLRFPAPFPVGSPIRLHAVVASAESVKGGTAVTLTLTFEREDGDRPVCVAEVLYRVLGENPVVKLAARVGPTFTFDDLVRAAERDPAVTVPALVTWLKRPVGVRDTGRRRGSSAAGQGAKLYTLA